MVPVGSKADRHEFWNSYVDLFQNSIMRVVKTDKMSHWEPRSTINIFGNCKNQIAIEIEVSISNVRNSDGHIVPKQSVESNEDSNDNVETTTAIIDTTTDVIDTTSDSNEAKTTISINQNLSGMYIFDSCKVSKSKCCITNVNYLGIST